MERGDLLRVVDMQARARFREASEGVEGAARAAARFAGSHGKELGAAFLGGALLAEAVRRRAQADTVRVVVGIAHEDTPSDHETGSRSRFVAARRRETESALVGKPNAPKVVWVAEPHADSPRVLYYFVSSAGISVQKLTEKSSEFFAKGSGRALLVIVIQGTSESEGESVLDKVPKSIYEMWEVAVAGFEYNISWYMSCHEAEKPSVDAVVRMVTRTVRVIWGLGNATNDKVIDAIADAARDAAEKAVSGYKVEWDLHWNLTFDDDETMPMQPVPMRAWTDSTDRVAPRVMFYRPRESFGKIDVVRCNNFLMHAKGRALLVIVQDAGDAKMPSGVLGRVVVSTNGSDAETVGAVVRLILGEGLGTAPLAKSASGRKPEMQSETGAPSTKDAPARALVVGGAAASEHASSPAMPISTAEKKVDLSAPRSSVGSWIKVKRRSALKIPKTRINRDHDAKGKDPEAKSEGDTDGAMGVDVAQSSDAPVVHAEEASVQGREEPTVESANNDGADQEDARVDLAELRRMRKMHTRDLLRSEPGKNVRRFCARSRVHDLCEIALLDEREISVAATDILQTLQKGDFGPRTPAQEAYLDRVLKDREMYAQIQRNDIGELVSKLGNDLVHETYGHVEVWDVRECTRLTGAFNLRITDARLDLSFWDTRKVGSMFSAFSSTSFDVDVSTWDVSGVTDMSWMFLNATGFKGDVREWDVGNVRTMEQMFSGASTFTGDVSLWDVGSVETMEMMFVGARSFNQDLSRWEVGNVTNMRRMFSDAESFECDLGRWDVSKVKTMQNMFRGATRFKGRGVEKWKRGQGVDVTDMFADAPLVQDATLYWAKGPLAILAELRPMRKMKTRDLLRRTDFGKRERRFCARSRVHDLCKIALSDEHDTDISGTATDILKALGDGEFGPRTSAQKEYLDMVLNERKMYAQIPDKSVKDLVAGLGEDLVDPRYGHVEVWDVRDCTTLEQAFDCIETIKGRLDLTFWDTRRVESMSKALRVTSFDVDVSTWDVSEVTSMSLMFSRATGFSGDLSEWDVSKVKFMGMMFRDAWTFNCDVSLWDVSRVQDMDSMFNGAREFNNDLSRWRVWNVTNMSRMFEGAESFECDLRNWDVSKVSTMQGMFRGAKSFTGGGVEHWKPAKGVDVTDMFFGAPLVQETTLQWANTLQVQAYGRAPSRLRRGFV
jgi:surface protein